MIFFSGFEEKKIGYTDMTSKGRGEGGKSAPVSLRNLNIIFKSSRGVQESFSVCMLHVFFTRNETSSAKKAEMPPKQPHLGLAQGEKPLSSCLAQEHPAQEILINTNLIKTWKHQAQKILNKDLKQPPYSKDSVLYKLETYKL